ncbi:MAG TPA: translocation/assembly module TamB domain-containing protein [Bryobacteraceae bacterium]|nr:translocation/assembly module TamB domain-containing protein [Bryobacteraceae bacterium]
MSRRLKRGVLYAGASLVALLLALAIAAVLILRSGSFERTVRDRIIYEAERVTGGRAEIGVFRFNWPTMTAEVAPFVLHGTEAPDTPPLFRADSIRVGLKIVSLLRHSVDLESLTIARPDLRIQTHPDGSTNFPHPRVQRHGAPFMQQIIRLAIRRMNLEHGFFEYNSVRLPLDLQGQQLEATLYYDAAGPRYRGDLSFARMRLNAAPVHDLLFKVATSFSIENDGLHVPKGRVTMSGSEVTFSGSMLDWAAPHGNFAVKGDVAVADAAPELAIHVVDRGRLSIAGRVTFDPNGIRVSGFTRGRGLNFHSPEFRFDNAGLTGNLRIDKAGMNIADLEVNALGGVFHGSAALPGWHSFHAEGEARGISVLAVARARGQNITDWDGTLAGPAQASGRFTIAGVRDVLASGTLGLTPVANGAPVSGTLHFAYDQRRNELQLADSHLSIRQTQVALSGTLGQTLTAQLSSGNLDDLRPLFSVVGVSLPPRLPVRLSAGAVANVQATIAGPLDNPTISGHAEAGPFLFERYPADHIAGDFRLTRTDLHLTNTAVNRGRTSLTAAGDLGLENWRAGDDSSVSARLTLKNGDLQQIGNELGTKLGVAGAVSGTAAVTGAWADPAIDARVDAVGVSAWGERFDRVTGSVRSQGDTVEVADAAAQSGSGSVQGGGRYLHAPGDWTSGDVRFNVASRSLRLARLQAVQHWRAGSDGEVEVNAAGEFHVARGRLAAIDSLDSHLAIRNASIGDQPFGSASVDARTASGALIVRGAANLRGAQVTGAGQWRLDDDYPGNGRVTFTPISFATLRDVAALSGPAPAELPFVGTTAGSISVSGPLRKPEDLRAEVRLDEVRLAPGPNTQSQAAVSAADLTVRNTAPVIFEVDLNGLTIRSARFAARDTTIEADGRVGFGANNRWEMNAAGSINLSILQLFSSDIIASGHSVISARLRGPLRIPRLNGRLELSNASLHLSNVPNGVEKANGVIVFDTERATIQSLTAESGGGHVALTGFVGFGGPLLTYRLGARAEEVRYRTPQGVSVTMDAALNMVGTSQSSVISGTITVTKAAFNPRTDLGTLLAQAAQPASTPSVPGTRFRGVRLDIRVESSQGLEIQSSLARDIEAEVNLHIRGTPDRPAVLGDLSVSQGQIDFFGTRYSINRGVVNFYNPVRFEPVLDLDLQTRIRGVTVNLTFSGPLNKLNVSYRSDPPLKSDQIVALLAVGRVPDQPQFLGSTQSSTGAGFMGGGGGNLLQEAIAAPVTGRLQRFFGVSHIKIDPQLTDITSVPQARLTVEQQISHDVTLTYITNLARTAEQIIRVEWDLSRKWSVVAVREDTGEFGIDFEYRKQFK